MATSINKERYIWIYKKLLSIYPKPYLVKYEDDMLQTFDDLLEDKQESEYFGLIFEEFLDILQCVMSEYTNFYLFKYNIMKNFYLKLIFKIFLVSCLSFILALSLVNMGIGDVAVYLSPYNSGFIAYINFLISTLIPFNNVFIALIIVLCTLYVQSRWNKKLFDFLIGLVGGSVIADIGYNLTSQFIPLYSFPNDANIALHLVLAFIFGVVIYLIIRKRFIIQSISFLIFYKLLHFLFFTTSLVQNIYEFSVNHLQKRIHLDATFIMLVIVYISLVTISLILVVILNLIINKFRMSNSIYQSINTQLVTKQVFSDFIHNKMGLIAFVSGVSLITFTFGIFFHTYVYGYFLGDHKPNLFLCGSASNFIEDYQTDCYHKTLSNEAFKFSNKLTCQATTNQQFTRIMDYKTGKLTNDLDSTMIKSDYYNFILTLNGKNIKMADDNNISNSESYTISYSDKDIIQANKIQGANRDMNYTSYYYLTFSKKSGIGMEVWQDNQTGFVGSYFFQCK